MLKIGGGGTKCFGVVLTWELEVLAILKGDTKGIHPLKQVGGGTTRFTVLKGGAKIVLDARFSLFVASPPRI